MINKQNSIENQINNCTCWEKKYEDLLIKYRTLYRDMDIYKQLLSIIADYNQIAYFAIDKNWQIIYVNQEAAHLFGMSTQRLLGSNLAEVAPNITARLCTPKYQKAIPQNTPLHFELFVETSGKWLEISVFSTQDILFIKCTEITKYKKSSEALHVTEEVFFKTFYANPSIMMIISLYDNRFIDVNESFLSVTGYCREEIIGHTLEEIKLLATEEDLGKIMVPFRKKLLTNIEVTYLTKSGDKRYGLVSKELINIGGIDCCLGVIVDITERKLATKALQESERRLADIINCAPDATLVIDIKGKVIAWNKAAEEMTGVKCEDIVGKSNYEYSIPFYGVRKPILADLVLKYKDRAHRIYNNIETKGETLEGENFCPAVGENGAYLRATATPLRDTQGNIVGAIQSIRDITDRKKAEMALQSSEEKYRRIVETANEGIWITNSEERTIFANRKLVEMFACRWEEIMGSSVFDFIEPDKVGVAKYYMNRRKQGIKEKHDFEYRRKDGSSLWAIVSATPIFDQNNQYLGSLKMITDITQRKKLEKEMVRLDRLNIISEIAAGIGHEIRNPMTTVRGYLQVLMMENDNKNNSVYELMIEELDRANSIITEFLSLAKNKAVELKCGNINQVVNSIFPLIKAEAIVQDKHINIDMQEVPDFFLDESEIRQLILNLVRNGLESMLPNKTLTISTSYQENQVILVVKDEGNGIEPEIIDKLGTPFTTTKENGTGLGLAVCYGIASRHNALIDVQTGPNGTSFFVKFKVSWEES